MRYAFADCILDTTQHLLLRAGTPVQIEPQVFDLVHLLVRNPGRMVSRDEIVEVVWNGRIVSESAISARIAAARKAVGDDGKTQAVIRTIARRGLQIAAEVAVQNGAQPEIQAQAETPNPPDTQRIRYTRDAQGRSLAYALTGNGPPLLRVGYTTTHLEAEWNTPNEHALFQDLGARHRLLRYDPVGFGMSDRSEVEIDFATIADNALAAADAAGFDRFAVFSESGGALTAIHLAAIAPDRVTKLVICGGYVDGRARRGQGATTGSFRSAVAEAWKSGDDAFFAAMLLPYFPEGPLQAVRDMGRNLREAASEATMIRIREAIAETSIEALLPDVRCPTLILHARNDAVHPLSEARKLASGIVGSELVVLETANHIPMPGNAVYGPYIRTILEFLAD